MDGQMPINPYRDHGPEELLRRWREFQHAVDVNVHSVSQALIERRGSDDSSIELSSVIRVLERSVHHMTLIHQVVDEILRNTNSYRIFCFNTKTDKVTVFTYLISSVDAVLYIITAALLIENTTKNKKAENPWIPFAIATLSLMVSIIKDFAWNELQKNQRSISRLASEVDEHALDYINGMIKSFQAMDRVNAKIKSTSTHCTQELEENLKAIGSIQDDRGFPWDLFIKNIREVQNSKPGSKLHAAAQLIIQRNRNVHFQNSILRPSNDFLYVREVQTEEDRRAALMRRFSRSSCSARELDVQMISQEIMEIRSTMNTTIDTINSEERQKDFSSLIILLENSKRELNDNFLYVLDTALKKLNSSEGCCSKMQSGIRSGIHVLANITTLIMLGLDRYQEDQEDQDDEQNQQVSGIAIAATGISIASLILGRLNDKMYQSFVQNKRKKTELEIILRTVEATIKTCEELIVFYRDLETLFQKETAITEADLGRAIEQTSRIPVRYMATATERTIALIKEKNIERRGRNPLGRMIQRIKSEEGGGRIAAASTHRQFFSCDDPKVELQESTSLEISSAAATDGSSGAYERSGSDESLAPEESIIDSWTLNLARMQSTEISETTQIRGTPVLNRPSFFEAIQIIPESSEFLSEDNQSNEISLV